MHASKKDLGESSSSSSSQEDDLLPDLHQFDPQPSDNDSSDYEENEDEEMVDLSDDSSIPSKLKKRKKVKKGINLSSKKGQSSKKSIKSAHPKMK